MTKETKQLIEELANQLEEAAINLKLRCGDIVNSKAQLVARAREHIEKAVITDG